MKKYDLFISYSRKDNNTAKQICSVLENYARHYKFKYFFDQDDIICRDEYLKRISSAISESKAMLFIASKNSYESEFCAKELLFADKRGVRIHQYRIDDAEIPLAIDMLLGTHQYREAKSTSIENFVREVLADSLRCTIESLSSLKEKERRLEDAKRREQADKYRIKQAKLDKLQSRSLEIQSQIISFQQAIMKLEKEKLLVEKEIRELGLTGINEPLIFGEIKSYKVGDYYNVNGKQGVVFEVCDNGQHGKIVSLDQKQLRWRKLDSQSIGATSESDGQSNTDIVMSRSDYNNYPAFAWCREQGEDWYLPSKNELLSLYHVKNQINKVLRDRCKEMINGICYWSSTEREFCAWNVFMYDGHTDYVSKSLSHYVRAVSAF
jgi:hypothetical protein